jgi:hypothetical protein
LEDKTSHEVHCTHSKTNFKSTSAKGRERERGKTEKDENKKTGKREEEEKEKKKKTGTEIREKKKLQRIKITSKENIGSELNFQLKYRNQAGIAGTTRYSPKN